MMNYLLSEIARITRGTLVGNDRRVCNVATDSRVENDSGALFFAIKGINHDGHKYIKALYDKGMHSFVVHNTYEIPKELSDASFIVVQSSMDALQLLASEHRNRYKGDLVGITGSNGKTTVKEWIAQMWNNSYGTLMRSPRSWNSQLGVALSLLQIEGDERLCVIEAGISQPGEMEKLWQMIKPTIGILTCIGTAHLENFKDSMELEQEKMKLFKGVKKLIKAPEEGNITYKNKETVKRLYEYLGIPFEDGKRLENVAMRMEEVEGILGSYIINDSYNSDYLSFPLALEYLKLQKKEKKIVILSDFKEDVSYTDINHHLLVHQVNLLIAIGPKFRHNASSITLQSLYYDSTEDFIKNIDISIFKDSVILIKGGRSWGMERISELLEYRTHTTTHNINLRALTDNLNYYRRHLPNGHHVMAMVKASGYGCGDAIIAKALEKQGVKYLDVAFADEGVTLREGGVASPIVVLNGDPGSFATMIKYHLEPEIYSFSALNEFCNEVIKAGEIKYPIHLKFDTGMHRLGFMEHEIDKLIPELLTRKEIIHISSVFSHFAASEDPQEDDFTRTQIARFVRMTDKLIQAFPYKILRHICNTAGIIRFPEAHFDMVRVGVGLYGAEDNHLQVVSTLKTRIVQIKFIENGETVGYNRRGKVGDDGKLIAIIPIGYADGVSRRLSGGNGAFCVKGVLCPTIGNICMDTTMIDISSVPDAKEGDDVVIFGECPTVEDIAKMEGTISYEVLTSISKRIKKIYFYD